MVGTIFLVLVVEPVGSDDVPDEYDIYDDHCNELEMPASRRYPN